MKEYTMKYLWILRIVGVIILLTGIAAVGYFAYTAGVAQGQTAVPAVAETDGAVLGHAVGSFHPARGLAFFPGLLCLAPLFLAFFIFMPLRMIFGPSRMPMRMHGRWHGCGDSSEVPPPVAEWHRRMHETKKESN
jgi:hypothetical protein